MKNEQVISIDAYISTFSKENRLVLNVVRKIIKEAAPGVKERINNGMPTFTFSGEDLVCFAGNNTYVEFYPTQKGYDAFHEELRVYKQGKGFVYFPLLEPLPYHLISRIVKYKYQSCFVATVTENITFNESII